MRTPARTLERTFECTHCQNKRKIHGLKSKKGSAGQKDFLFCPICKETKEHTELPH